MPRFTTPLWVYNPAVIPAILNAPTDDFLLQHTITSTLDMESQGWIRLGVVESEYKLDSTEAIRARFDASLTTRRKDLLEALAALEA